MAPTSSAPASTPPSSTPPPPDHSITISGSADLVADFFSYAVNTLLFLRGVYPPDTFKHAQKYGVTVYLSTDQKVQAYLQTVLTQMRTWLHNSALRRLVVIIASAATRNVLERWAFDVNLSEHHQTTPTASNPTSQKDPQRIMSEIQAIIRQISATVTFLPLLDEACSFDILIYTDKAVQTPTKWHESGPRTIPNAEQVTLRSFSTSLHNVDASVSFSITDD
ncbi:Mitotic spindle assembly checkpoint protein MAD2A [Gracilariopsis chorda]|uniref:Mitotic spindle assembly checkpoint protein MAD2A n=1 Tax=Gracilariopsis chorda TaxID=448386 RepID=A0A2V3INQ4_9FLOR|nr:Mitotic spindle assembly checkpoint protein MAD2A [Gracilariopsis chorda]|eukprot:PXF43715.1 Mitotic spindle assembly checkpoint protein MAD2A [Gracilariopsis chorda]